MDQVIKTIDAIIEGVGKFASYLVLIVLAIIIAEMAMRGIIGKSLPFAEDLVSWLLVAIVFLGGPYALAKGKFVRVDALYERFSARTKAIVDTTLSSALLSLFLFTMIKFGTAFTLKSFNNGEVSATGAWDGPVWVSKSLIPIGCCLILLAWISHLAKMWRDVNARSTN